MKQFSLFDKARFTRIVSAGELLTEWRVFDLLASNPDRAFLDDLAFPHLSELIRSRFAH